jgi:hypothetical protein
MLCPGSINTLKENIMAKRQSLETRFNQKYKINEVTDCWEWQNATNNIGYGFIRDGKKMRTAHRVSHELHLGDIPKGSVVCHSCDNPKCVNPDHLWTGTMRDNHNDMVSKGRRRSRCKGTKMPIGTCKHCGITQAVNLIGRNHNDKCKHKP